MIETTATRLIARLVLPLSWVLALALLVKGHLETGDGFSAGLAAATGVLIHSLVLGQEQTRRLFVVRHAFRIAGVGLLLVLLPLVVPVLLGSPPVTHYPRPGTRATALGSFALQSGILIDLGVFALVLAFVVGIVDRLSRAASGIREGRP